MCEEVLRRRDPLALPGRWIHAGVKKGWECCLVRP